MFHQRKDVLVSASFLEEVSGRTAIETDDGVPGPCSAQLPRVRAALYGRVKSNRISGRGSRMGQRAIIIVLDRQDVIEPYAGLSYLST